MANIFGGVEPPRWLQEIASPPRSNWGSLAGTALAGGLMSALSRPEEEGGQGRISFIEGVQRARLNQADPMWQLKAKQIESQVANANAMMSAKWLDYDRKAKDAEWLQQSMDALSDWSPENPVPPTVTHPKALNAAMQQRQVTVGLKLKAQDAENKLAAAQQKIDLESQRLGLATERLGLDRAKLATQQEQFEQKIAAQTALETQRQQGRMDVAKLNALAKVDAAGRPLTKQQYINRHLNAVYAQMVRENPAPDKPITVKEVQDVLSEAYDSMVPAGSSGPLPKVISILPAP